MVSRTPSGRRRSSWEGRREDLCWKVSYASEEKDVVVRVCIGVER